MKLVIIESPYAGDIERNVEYARRCVRHSLSLGEAPIASHLLYTQPGILRDEIPNERNWGINAGLAWRKVAELSAVYVDLGVTKGMEYGVAAAKESGVTVVYRQIGTRSSHRSGARRHQGNHMNNPSLVLFNALLSSIAQANSPRVIEHDPEKECYACGWELRRGEYYFCHSCADTKFPLLPG